MKNEYDTPPPNTPPPPTKTANSTLADIEDKYCGGIDYEDEDGEHEFTKSDMDDLFHLLCKLEEALKSEIKYEEEA